MEAKKKVIETKRKLRERKDRIKDDLTMEERRVRWKIKNETGVERRKEKVEYVECANRIYEDVSKWEIKKVG